MATDAYFVSTDSALLDLDVICALLSRSYWAGQRPRRVIEQSLRGSLCFGVYETSSRRQRGFARVVTDHVTFSWLCDVIVDEEHRHQGLGKLLLAAVVAHPSVRGTQCLLGTADAHGLYEQFGFQRSEQMKRLPSRSESPTPRGTT